MGLHGYIDDQLFEDEQILYRAHLSWVPIILHLIPFVLIGSAVGGIVWTFMGFGFAIIAPAIVFVIGILTQLPHIYKNLSTDIVVTNRRMYTKHGIFAVKDDRSSDLSRIDDCDIDFNTYFNRIFKYGNIEIQTLGGNNNFFTFENLSRPRLLKQAVNRAKDAYAAWGDQPGRSFIKEQTPYENKKNNKKKNNYNKKRAN